MFVPSAPAQPEAAPAAELDEPAELSVERLDAEIAALAAHINAATCRWLLLVAEFDRRAAHEEWGFSLCSQWLAWRCAISPRAAREHVRVARRLGDLPRVRDGFAAGELSYSKVRVLTRIDGIEREAELVELARHATAAQLERMGRAYSGVVSAEQASAAHARRHLSWHWDDDGSLCVSARLPAEEGATFLLALEAARAELQTRRRGERDQHDEDEVGNPGEAEDAGRGGGSAEPQVGGEAGDDVDPKALLLGDPPNNADALALVAESMLAHGASERAAPDRHLLTVHVDAEAMLADGEAPGCEYERGPVIPAEVARRLGCDATLVAIAKRDGRPLGVGRRQRTVPARLRHALRARDRGCAFPGCSKERFLDAHHIRHWAHGGETNLDNLVLLCRAHHRAVHEGGFALERLDDDSLVFRRPDGKPLPFVPDPHGGDGAYIEREHERLGIEIGSETGMSLSAGEPMDLGLAVDALVHFAPP